MKLTIPFVVDDIDDSANASYAAWPDRLYVVGADGRVAYQGGKGPFGFKPAEAREALAKLLGVADTAAPPPRRAPAEKKEKE